jgi:Uma2 family endonuclease
MINSALNLPADRIYTYADYLTWQFDNYVELLRGKILAMSPAPLRVHQKIAGKLHGEILNFLRKHPCEVYIAPFDVRFPRRKDETKDEQITTVLQPDLCVICDLSKLDARGCLGAPDWIIEILSAGNSAREMREKYRVYEESGVREYWIVNPENETILPYILENETFIGKAPMIKGDKVSPYIFPDLVIDLDYIFESEKA